MLREEIKVRFCETDALAHVSNTVLVQWFETAREPIFRMFNPELDLKNWPLILASYKVDFLQQIYYGKLVEVRTFVSRIGNSSFDIYQELWQNEQHCATGVTTLVHFDFTLSKTQTINETVRQQLQAHFKV
ncbi:acyl-CoA thioesterase [Flavobacterium sp. W21_SRS_FM6]|uniref:acyl-CoA thioesterase n=1 Tax=Flavobacterium sp. W21_SRS_FM6 TaxID=3240268 RepID=UPI003F8F0A78